MGKDTCIKANTYCPVCRGITGTDCWHSARDFSIPRTDWKQVDELSALRTQNAELLAERAGVISQSKMHPSWLDKSKEEILDCLRFQWATTAALLNQTDEQAERIRELEGKNDGFNELTGLMQKSLEEDTTRIGELSDENQQLRAALISAMDEFEHMGAGEDQGSP